MKISGKPQTKPNTPPKRMMKSSSLLPTSRKMRLISSGVLLDVADDHQLHVEQLVDVLADLVGDLVDDVGQLLLDALVDASRTRGGSSFQSCGCSRSMIRSTRSRMSPLRGDEDLLGDLLGLELLVEVAGLPTFAIPLSTAIEPIFAARDGMIPCQPTPPCITPGICWIRRGSTRASGRSPGTRTPLNSSGSNSIQTPLQFVA